MQSQDTVLSKATAVPSLGTMIATGLKIKLIAITDIIGRNRLGDTDYE